MNKPAPPHRLDRRLRLAAPLLGPGKAQEKFFAENPAQPIDKSRFGRVSRGVGPLRSWVTAMMQTRQATQQGNPGQKGHIA
jgi:hypothetical protein